MFIVHPISDIRDKCSGSVTDVGVAVVPGSSFYHDPALGNTKVRFCFCKRDETLWAADRRLAKLADLTASSRGPGPRTSVPAGDAADLDGN